MGSISMIVYVLIGIAGAPVFAQFKAGIGILFGSTGGFLLSYIVAAFITGKIMEMRGKPTFSIFLISSLVGIAVIYLIGTTYMYIAVNYWLEAPAMTYAAAWKIMSWFAVKDLIFTVLGAMLAPRIYKALRSSSYLSNTQSNKVSKEACSSLSRLYFYTVFTLSSTCSTSPITAVCTASKWAMLVASSSDTTPK